MVKAFISSEMGSSGDAGRRAAAKAAIEEIGHQAVTFEALPARPLPAGVDPLEQCRILVRGSDVLLAIIDDEVSDAMAAEIEAADDALGQGRVFYYFTRRGRRSSSAAALWEAAKDTNMLAVFESDAQLGAQIKKSVGSYIDDVLRSARRGVRVFLDKDESVAPDALKWWSFELEEGDTVQATLYAPVSFYATVCSADVFAKRLNNRRTGPLATGNDKKAHHLELNVDEDGEYYLMIRSSAWQTGATTIHVKMVVR
jgi:hypothetical protein